MKAVKFQINTDTLLGIAHSGDSEIGVVIVVGGPQYRIGSHRQFYALSCALSKAGFASFRFDCRGMGNSDGDFPGFLSLDQDIKAAIDAFMKACPHVKKIVLWGLCDAATAIVQYASCDHRVKGLCLLNPWVKNAEAESRAMREVYYARRIMQKDFWLKLFTRNFWYSKFKKLFRRLTQKTEESAAQSPIEDTRWVQAHYESLANMRLPTRIILSEYDLVAKTFTHGLTAKVKKNTQIEWLHLPSDHTFSCAHWRGLVEKQTIEWLNLTGTSGGFS